MKINDKIKIRTVAGENIVIMQDATGSDLTRVVALNESALFLYNQLLSKQFEVDDIVRLLTEEYEVNEADARKDAEAWVAEMKKNELVL
jgi:hypothetical protein